MNRERWLNLYSVAIGLLGWLWVAASAPFSIPIGLLLLFVVLAVAVEALGFRVPPADPHSLVGIVLLTAALTFGIPEGALVAAFSGFIFGILRPIIYSLPLSFYSLVARPLLRSGVRALAILLSGQLIAMSGTDSRWFTMLILSISYFVFVQLSRTIRELLQGGRSGLATWWSSSWSSALLTEAAPLPFSMLGAQIYLHLGLLDFMLGGAALLAASVAVRWGMMNLRRQHSSVRELALLNEVSRAIIRSELDANALCELIYRETSKVVDTSSFHLGLFTPGSDRYTLMVRVQDRVRLPQLSVDLPTGDGLVGWIRETGQALLVHDFTTELDQLPAQPRYQSDRPPRSGIYVPLITGDEVLGSISIQSYRPNAFGTEDLRLLSLIADQAAIAISKARVFEQARQRAVQLQAIHEVSERITAILDLDELLPSVVALIHEHFEYHPVHIFTLDESGTLVFRASTAESERLSSIQQHARSSLIGEVAQHGKPILINDMAHDPRYAQSDSLTMSELAVPLRYGDQLIGVLDVQSTQVARFAESDLFVVRTLADQIAIAIESARAFTAQREEAWTLNALLQVAENTAHAATLDELLPIIVRMPPLLLGCDRCYCLLWNREHETYTPLAAYGLLQYQRSNFIGKPIAEADCSLLADARKHLRPTVAGNPLMPIYATAASLGAFGGNTLLALPLTARGALLGMLVADYNAANYQFTNREKTLYNGISNHLAGALESALLAEEAAKVAKLESELRVARDIQTALLPASTPKLPGWQIAADWRSARLVGGDFYDFWKLPTPLGMALAHHEEAEFGFVIADVSDKGVPAAMFMALSRSLVRAAALDGSSPSVALARANRWITRDSESAMFVTLFYGVLQPRTGHLRFSCAGHNPPLLLRADSDKPDELTTHDIALGVLEEVELHEQEVDLLPGDILVCYTDGVTEAINLSEDAFGVPRLIDIIKAHRNESAEAILAAINTSFHDFTNGSPPFDDVTLLILKRTASGAIEQATAKDSGLRPLN